MGATDWFFWWGVEVHQIPGKSNNNSILMIALESWHGNRYGNSTDLNPGKSDG